MTITTERKEALVKEYGRVEGDTGSPEVQVALTRVVKRYPTHQR